MTKQLYCSNIPRIKRERTRERIHKHILSALFVIAATIRVLETEPIRMADSRMQVPQRRRDTSTSGAGTATSSEAPVEHERKGKKGAPRLYHKKSRKGCQRCRARRVKVRFASFLLLPTILSQWCITRTKILGFSAVFHLSINS